MIISAGSYLLNKTLAFDSSEGYLEGNIDISIPFTFIRVASSGIRYTITCSRMYSGVITNNNVSTYELAYTCDSVSPAAEFVAGSYFVYNENYGGWTYESNRIINVLADTEVDDESGAWFTNNTSETEPVLKGVFMLNETLIAPPASVAHALDFDSGGMRDFSDISFSVSSDGSLAVYYKQTQEDLFGEYTNDYTVYTSKEGWKYGWRRVEIGRAQPVSKEFYTAFMSNVVEITDRCTLVNYGDKQIAVLEPDQHFRLNCTNKNMDSDVTVMAARSNKVEIIPSEYVKPAGEVRITENGTWDVAGKKTAVVDVPVPEGDITITKNGTYDVAGKKTAVVDVATIIPDEYVIPAGSVTITENGTWDVAGKKTAVVDVPIPERYYGDYMDLTEES